MALLSAITLAVFWQAFSFDYVSMDDYNYIGSNRMVTGGLTAGAVKAALTKTWEGAWIPLTWISYMIDVSVFGLKPSGFHVTNVLLHLANVLLLFWILRSATGAVWKSFFVAALFAVHPMRAESVAWITERKDVLAGLFFLLALHSHIGWAKNKSRVRYFLTIFFTFLSLLAKPMAVTMPAALLLLDFWPLGRFPAGGFAAGKEEHKKLIMEKLPLFALVAVFSVVTLVMQANVGNVGQGKSGFEAVLYGLANASRSYWIYLYKTFWPVNLPFEYQSDLTAFQKIAAIPGFLGLAGASFLAFRRRDKAPAISFGWFWYLLVLLPVSGIIPVGVQNMADRFTYLPHIGVFTALVWGAEKLLTGGKNARIALAALGALSVTASAGLCYVQASHWKDTPTLFKYMDSVGDREHRNPYQAFQIGSRMADEGNYQGAMEFFRTVIKTNPNFPGVYFRASFTALKAGRTEEAMQLAQTGVSRGDLQSGIVLGNIYAMKGIYAEARRQYEEVIRKDPGNVDALFNLAQMVHVLGQDAEAIRFYGEVTNLDETNWKAHEALSQLYRKTGDTGSALRHKEKADRLKAQRPPGH